VAGDLERVQRKSNLVDKRRKCEVAAGGADETAGTLCFLIVGIVAIAVELAR
jgi:hypothetical protein